MGFIYSITNPKGQVYIGATKNFKNRMLLHRHDYKKKKKARFLLYISINMYGWDNHTFSVIEEVGNEQLKNKEVFWIEKMNTYAYGEGDGLNMTLGGNHSLGNGKGKGKGGTKEKKLKAKKNTRQVAVYSLDGNFIGSYPSCRQASIALGLKEGDAARVARGTSASTHDYIFRFHNGVFDAKINTDKIVIKKVNIPIVQINEYGGVIREYKSSAEAAKVLNVCRKKVHRAVNIYSGKKNSTGYLFMSKERHNQVINN